MGYFQDILHKEENECELLNRKKDWDTWSSGDHSLPPFSLIRDFQKQSTNRNGFQNFRQSYMLSTVRIEIHQSQPVGMM